MNYTKKRVLMQAQRLAGLLSLLHEIDDQQSAAQVKAKCGLHKPGHVLELDTILSAATRVIGADCTPGEVGAVLASEISRARSGLRRALHALEQETCKSN